MKARQLARLRRRLARHVRLWSTGATLVSLLVVPMVLFAHERKGEARPEGRIRVSPAVLEAIDLRTGEIQTGELARHLGVHALVTVPSQQQAYASSPVAGVVKRLSAQLAKKVKAGEELAWVESPELVALQIEMLQIARELDLVGKSADRDETAERAEETLEGLPASRARKAATLQIVRRRLRSLGLDEQAVRKVLSNGEPVSGVSVKSPHDGIVDEVNAGVGRSVQPSQDLIKVVDLSTVQVAGQLPETEAYRVRTGMPVRVSFTAVPGKTFEGRIEAMASSIERPSRSLPLWLTLENQEGLLRPGMFGLMRIEIERVTNALLCPTDALFEVADETFVLLEQRPGSYIKRRVTVRLRSGEQAAVLGDLFPGDRVVVKGTYELAEMFRRVEEAKKEATVVSESHTAEMGSDEPALLQAPAAAEGESGIVANAVVELPTGQKILASSAIGGRVARIAVARGQAVSAGQVLVEVFSPKLQALQFELLEARAQLDWARKLLKGGGGSGPADAASATRLQVEHDKAQDALTAIRRNLIGLGISQAQIDQVLAGGAIAATLPVRSPADGIVAEVPAIGGQAVRPDQPLVEVHDLSKVWVRAFVSEREASRVQPGQRTWTRIASDPGFLAIGSVMRTSPSLSSTGRMLSVWTGMENPDAQLKEGMLARVTITVETGDEQLAVGGAGRDSVTLLPSQATP